MTDSSDSKKLWGGRFAEKTAASVEAFTASIHFDARLYRHDIAGSSAHAKMLAKQQLISAEECQQILAGLSEIEKEIDAGTFEFKPELEDIHMNIEKALADKIGQAGEKLHTARSRNDQVCLDIRLYLREESGKIIELLHRLRKTFVDMAEEQLGVMLPGYTHLQRAQPVLLSHHLLAYFEMFGRDTARIEDCLKRINVMPLGAAALAGTGLPIDREFVAKELDFPEITANSMDTVGDRDFAVEFLAAATLIQIHLSRLAEELVLWSSEEFSFISLADGYCTGSSIMPQKKNPDIPELIRGKSGRVIGNLIALITILKGLPLTYNRDLQEDKEPIFDTVDTIKQCLAITSEMLSHSAFNKDRMLAATDAGFITATDLADYLVIKGIPFRSAHSIVGRTVAYCIKEGKNLSELAIDQLRSFSAAIEDDVFSVLSVEGSVNSRTSAGGTALTAVQKAIEKARATLA
ncbi:MAG: argininosuccinate lyase [Proteobacteria bacterium]|nr:argininosuccinate lyase [Pseudomonadota bacterium]MBU1709726.1 argininosuccinate lyase [Pseudomonadota bacterium]